MKQALTFNTARRIKTVFLKFQFLMLTLIYLTACNAWEDSLKLKDDNLNLNLSTLISESSEISIFSEILKITGWDEKLSNEHALTVFAPQNEVLKQMDLTDKTTLSQWIENYIAHMSYFTDEAGSFIIAGTETNTIEMINGKQVPVYSSLFVKRNIYCTNGVLHIINDILEFRKSIWDYLQEHGDYQQVQFIQSFTETVIDMDKSIQTGVDQTGRPVYDTIWTQINTFLDKYPITDERQSFTFILLENSGFDALKNDDTKYRKYFKRNNADEQYQEILTQLTGDLILEHTIIDQARGYYSLYDAVLVDIDPANIIDEYKASNGMVYKISAADIKMYHNKIKESVTIEGEDFVDSWDGQNAWITRYRSWASGGKDAVLQGRTRQSFTWNVYYPENDSTATKTASALFYNSEAGTATYVQSSSVNAYLKYEPTLYSCEYKIYWKTYDDLHAHHYRTVTELNDSISIPMTLEQKILISFPGYPALVRESNGTISNHFTPYSLMAGRTQAGINEETQLVRYRRNAEDSYLGLYMLDVVSDATDDGFGKGEILRSPTQGKATFFVANTVRAINADAGLVYLDYIRLVPQVDIND